MGIILALIFLPLCLSFDLPECFSQVKIDNNHYNLSHTIDVGDGFSVDAHYDVYGNLFYVKSGRKAKLTTFDIYILKFDSDTPVKVPGLPEDCSYSVAIDKLYTNTYFGTQNGIYKYDYSNGRAALDSRNGFKLDMILIDKDGNKYITEGYNGVEELYVLDGEKKIRYNVLQDFNELVIDEKNNFHFIKAEQLFTLKSNSLKPRFVANVTYNGIAQITFWNGKVFVASQNLCNVRDNGMKQFVDNVPEKLTAIAFDKSGNFIVGTYGKLLRYNKNDCYLREKLNVQTSD